VLPGKKYTPEDILRIARRRAWLFVIPLVIGTAAAAVVSTRLPAWYRSETLIMLMPQRVPDSYVKATITEKMEDRLATLEDQILSRSRLERIILDLDLYANSRRLQPLEKFVERMRKEITIKVEGKESFRLSYVSQDAQTVQKATQRLASLFIEENLRDREKQAEDTNDFLDSQLQDARRRLLDHEKKLEEYRRQYSGQLPTQGASNLQAIQNLQMQLQALGEASDRAAERRSLLERQFADLQLPDPVAVAAPSTVPNQDATAVDSTPLQLDTARTRLAALLTRVKPNHPDVEMLQRAIRGLEAKQREESKDSAAAGQKPAERVVSPAEALRQRRSRELKSELDVLDQEQRDKQQQEKRLRDRVAEYQSKLDAMPSRESELVELTRDYRTLQTTYESLLVKREDAKLAANLERRNIGEQFKVLDPARVPEQPYSPNRILIVAGGAAGGLAIGLLVIGLIEYRDSSFTREDEVVRLCQVPVLALVPIMMSVEERGRTRRRRVATIAATAAGLVASAAALAVWRLRL
jgi:polysaccharide chain length determinant protein (PEP-CTERM system associated)